MPTIKKTTSDGRYDIPAGTHLGYCTAIIDLGTQPSNNPKYPDPKRKVKLAFEIPSETYKTEDWEEKPKIIYTTYTLSTADRALFRPVFEALFTWKPEEDDYYEIDFNKLVGNPCSITVAKEWEYSNVKQVAWLPKWVSLSPMHNKPLVFDLDKFDQKVFDNMWDKMKEQIKASPEYQTAIDWGSFREEEDKLPF